MNVARFSVLVTLSTLLACTSDSRSGDPLAIAQIDRALDSVEAVRDQVIITYQWGGQYPDASEASAIMTRLDLRDPDFEIELDPGNGEIFVYFGPSAQALIRGESLSFLPRPSGPRLTSFRCLSTIEDKTMLPSYCRD